MTIGNSSANPSYRRGHILLISSNVSTNTEPTTMKRTTITKSLVVIISIPFLFLTSCGKLFWIEIECRDFELTVEKYWFPESVNQSVIFVNSSGEEKEFIVTEKISSHVTNYFSDTGCGCRDYSNMTLVSESDSIYLQRVSTYVYDNEAETIEDLVFKFNLEHSIFFETNFIEYRSIEIEDIVFDSVKVYSQTYNEGERINQLFLKKGIGILQYVTHYDEVWINKDLSIKEENNISSIDYNDYVCE